MISKLEATDLFDIRLPAYLTNLRDGPGNCLVLVLEEATGLGPEGLEAIADPATPTDVIINDIVRGGREIVPGRGDRLIEVTFEQPVAYAVTDESFAGPERDGLPAAGRVARLVENSWMDDFVGASTWATNEFPGALRHYRLVTLSHVVNVVSANEPALQLLGVEE